MKIRLDEAKKATSPQFEPPAACEIRDIKNYVAMLRFTCPTAGRFFEES